MKANRRRFISTAVGGGLATVPARSAPAPAISARYRKLDEILKQPVLKKQLFSTPVIIETLELLRLDNSYLCRVRSRDGAEGISVAHSGMSTLFPIFLKNLQPFFLGKDARELDLILEKVYIYGFNFRLNGIALGLPLATIEFAILDMLGRIAQKPVGQLIGEIHNPEVGVYMATRVAREAGGGVDQAHSGSRGGLRHPRAEDQGRRADVHDHGHVCRGPSRTDRSDDPARAQDVRRQDGALCRLEQLLFGSGGDPRRQTAGRVQVRILRRAGDVRPHRGDQSRWPTRSRSRSPTASRTTASTGSAG